MSHTPGPWSHGHIRERNGEMFHVDGIFAQAEKYPEDVDVARVSGLPMNTRLHEIADNPRYAQPLANARLIAAAPELLDALRAMVTVQQHADECGESTHGTECDCGVYEKLVTNARAAIAKAEGR